VNDRPDKDSPATEYLIDACFKKMSSVYEQYKFSEGDWKNTEEILGLEALSPQELTYGNLLKYYELHFNLWKSSHAKANSLNDRMQKILTQT